MRRAFASIRRRAASRRRAAVLHAYFSSARAGFPVGTIDWMIEESSAS